MHTPTIEQMTQPRNPATCTVRRARKQDVPALVKLGAQTYAAASHLAHLTFSAAHLASTLKLWIEQPQGLVLVASVGDQLVGAVVGLVSSHWLASESTAYAMGFIVPPEFAQAQLPLFEAFKASAIRAGAELLNMTAAPGEPGRAEAAIFQAAGMHRVAEGFEMALRPSPPAPH